MEEIYVASKKTWLWLVSVCRYVQWVPGTASNWSSVGDKQYVYALKLYTRKPRSAVRRLSLHISQRSISRTSQ